MISNLPPKCQHSCPFSNTVIKMFLWFCNFSKKEKRECNLRTVKKFFHSIVSYRFLSFNKTIMLWNWSERFFNYRVGFEIDNLDNEFVRFLTPLKKKSSKKYEKLTVSSLTLLRISNFRIHEKINTSLMKMNINFMLNFMPCQPTPN